MKKIIIAAAAIAAFASCAKENTPAAEQNQGVTVFTGSAVETKIALGDKNGTLYDLKWQEGDKLGVYVDGELLGTATLTSGAGQKIGKFTLDQTIADGTVVDLVYPADGTAKVEPRQIQKAGEFSFGKDIFGLSEEITVNNGNASFGLYYFNSIVKITLSSAALKDWKVKEVMFDCYKTPVSGEYKMPLTSYNPEIDAVLNGTTTTTEGGASVKFETPVALSENPVAYIAVLPCETEGKKVYLTARLEKDGVEAVVSKAIRGSRGIGFGCVTSIKWEDIDFTYTDLAEPVVFDCNDDSNGGKYTSAVLDEQSPMFSTRTKGNDGHNFGSGHGIKLCDNYGEKSGAWFDLKTVTPEVEMCYSTGEKGQFGFFPFFQDDYIAVHVPVSNLAAGTKLSFECGMRSSNAGSPKYFVFEYSEDGKTWVAAEEGASLTCGKTSTADYNKAVYTVKNTITNGFIHVRARANGDTVMTPGKDPSNRAVRFIFHKENKADFGGPILRIVE